MKLHPREAIVRQARSELCDQIGHVDSKFGLTHSEMISILSEAILSYTKYAIRIERHGDASVPGGIERDANEAEY